MSEQCEHSSLEYRSETSMWKCSTCGEPHIMTPVREVEQLRAERDSWRDTAAHREVSEATAWAKYRELKAEMRGAHELDAEAPQPALALGREVARLTKGYLQCSNEREQYRKEVWELKAQLERQQTRIHDLIRERDEALYQLDSIRKRSLPQPASKPMREALERLENEARLVYSMGAVTGTQWPRLAGALRQARAALAAPPDEKVASTCSECGTPMLCRVEGECLRKRYVPPHYGARDGEGA